MTLAKFARLNESLEFLTPTQSIVRIKNDWENFSDPITLTQILTLDYPMNNLGNKRAVKWIASSMGVFDDDIERAASVHLDLGDGVYSYDENKEYSNITLKQFLRLLSINCNKMDSDSFKLFDEYFNQMNPLEKKWFVRYWVRTPRNGIQSGTVKKLISKIYGKKMIVINKHCKFNTLTEIVDCYMNDITPSTNLRMGVFVPPMLAKSMKKKDWPKSQILEYKYDGARYQIHKTPETVIIFNRKGKIVNKQYADIIEMVSNWDYDSFIIDTEIYPINADGSPAPFQQLGTRIHSKNHAEAAQKCPVTLAVFDCLMLDGKTLIDESLSLRIDAMGEMPNQAVRSYDDFESFYSQSIALGFEGIMIKNTEVMYDTGKRSKHWVKYKPPRIDLDVVILGARYGDGKNGHVFSSFDIGVINDSGFDKIGCLGGGFKEIELVMLTNKLKPLTTSYDNGTFTLLPRVVLTVTADLVSKNRDNTYALRFPRMKCIRNDKPVTEINTIDDVVMLV
jgi:DNA ligase-1